MTTHTTPTPASRPLAVERHGTAPVPDTERTARPRDVAAILLGSNLCLGVVVFGWLPVSFGLSLGATVSSMVVGTLVGTCLVAPLALVSLRTGTNLSTSSGAFFGVRGRLVGSVIGLLLVLGYAALTLWTGAAAVVGPLHRLFGLPGGDAAYVATYAVLAALAVLVAVVGYRLLAAAGRWLAVGMGATMLLGLVALSGDLTAGPTVDGYLLGGFWPTWFLSVVAAGLSGPIAFVTILGDYTRYVSPVRHDERRVLVATALGMVGGLLVPQLFGTVTALAARAGDDYVGALVAASPGWYLVPLLAVGLFGTVGNAGALLYSTGLDLDAILPRISRVRATVVTSIVATTVVVVGHFTWEAVDAVTAFVLLLTTVGAPWAVVTLVGHRRSGGRPVFRPGWNGVAVLAWAAGSVGGLLAVDSTLWSGPLVAHTGGVDLSFLLAGATTYAVLAATRWRPASTEVVAPKTTRLPEPVR
jgi:purine-cytosine permease-like protein